MVRAGRDPPFLSRSLLRGNVRIRKADIQEDIQWITRAVSSK
jgi:hypothetical protein